MSALVVSIHDVSPDTRDAVTFILSALARIGIRRTSLLVVPDYHRRGNITLDPEFCAWLREQVAAGHEPVLHGYFHERPRHSGETLRTRFFTRAYTADEGEFFDLPPDDARNFLKWGRDELAQCAGVIPAGFIAPAWLLNPTAEDAARDLGFDYTTRLRTVSDLARGRLYQSQSLCWSVRDRWRRRVSRLWNHLLFHALHPNSLFRISIHPVDLAHPKIWYQIQHLTFRALEAREAMTYHHFITNQRSQPLASP